MSGFRCPYFHEKFEVHSDMSYTIVQPFADVNLLWHSEFLRAHCRYKTVCLSLMSKSALCCNVMRTRSRVLLLPRVCTVHATALVECRARINRRVVYDVCSRHTQSRVQTLHRPRQLARLALALRCPLRPLVPVACRNGASSLTYWGPS